MLRIRLTRVGKKKQPSYRIVVAEKAFSTKGRYVEWIGNYNPLVDPPAITIEEERAKYWLEKGAQPSSAVNQILTKQGILKTENEQ